MQEVDKNKRSQQLIVRARTEHSAAALNELIRLHRAELEAVLARALRHVGLPDTGQFRQLGLDWLFDRLSRDDYAQVRSFAGRSTIRTWLAVASVLELKARLASAEMA